MIHLDHMVWAKGVTTGTNTLCKSPETIISPYVFQPSPVNHSWGEFGQFSKSVCMLVSMISLDIFVAMFSVLEKKLFRRFIICEFVE